MKSIPVRKRVWLPLLFVLALTLGARYLSLHHLVNPEDLRALVEKIVSEQFGGRAHIERIKLGLFSGVVLKGVTVSKQGTQGLTPFLRMDALRLVNYLQPLLKGKFVIREVDIESPTIFLIRDCNGRWNIEPPTEVTSGEGLSGGAPMLASVAVHDATVVLRDELGGTSLPAMRIAGVNFTAFSREPGVLPFTLTGRIAASLIGPCLVSGSLDLQNGVFNLTVSRKGLLLDDDLARVVHSFNPAVFDKISSWSGRVDLRFNLTYDLTGATGLRYQVSAKFLGDRLVLKDIPYPIQGVGGSVTLSDERLAFHNVRGRCGPLRFIIDGSVPMARQPGVSAVAISILNLPLNYHLAAMLGREVTEVWRHLNPTGQLDIMCTVRACLSDLLEVMQSKRPLQSLRAYVSIFLKDCAIAHESLGLPIQHINGQLDITVDRLILRGISGEWRGSRIEASNTVLSLSRDAPIDLTFRLNHLQLTKDLRCLLPAETQATWDLFEPSGIVDAQINVRRAPGESSPWQVTTTLSCVKDCAFTYQEFPRRVSNLQGVIEFRPEGVVFQGVSGEAGRAKVVFADTLIPYDPSAPFNFEFEAKGAEFDQELYAALSPQLKEVYDRINPVGRFDLEWHQQRLPGKKSALGKTIYDVVVRPQGVSATFKDVPYPISNIRGMVTYDGHRVIINRLVGQNRGAHIVLEGRIPQGPSGGLLHLQIAGHNIPLDDEVRQLLPTAYQSIWDTIAPQGIIHFKLLMNDGIDELGEPLLRYSVPELYLQNCQITPRVPVTNIRGRVKLSGEIRKDPKSSWASGEIKLDEATVEGKKYESVDATFHNEWDTLTFPYIVAQCYGGKVIGELKINKGESFETSGYEAFFRAENVSAGQLCASTGLGLKGLEGAIFADLRAEAKSWKKEDINADGSLRITQGHLGDLPTLLGVTDKLGGDPNKPAFTDADFEYIISENVAVIKKALLLGPTLNLKGEGKITLDGDLALEFRPEPSSQGSNIPILSSLWGGMVSAAFTVTVSGTIWNPIIRVDPLIPINKLMQGLSAAFQAAKKEPKK